MKSVAERFKVPYWKLTQAVHGDTFADLLKPPPVPKQHSRLRVEQVAESRRRAAADSNFNITAQARKYGVAPASLHKAVSGVNFRTLLDPPPVPSNPKHHPPTLVSQARLAAQDAPISQIAQELNLPYNTVVNWVRGYTRHDCDVAPVLNKRQMLLRAAQIRQQAATGAPLVLLVDKFRLPRNQIRRIVRGREFERLVFPAPVMDTRDWLTLEIVSEARQRVAAGDPLVDVAADLQVSYRTLQQAVRGISWGWVEDPPPVHRIDQVERRRLGREQFREFDLSRIEELPALHKRGPERELTVRDVADARRAAARGVLIAVLAYRYCVSDATIAAAVAGAPPWDLMTSPPPIPTALSTPVPALG